MFEVCHIACKLVELKHFMKREVGLRRAKKREIKGQSLLASKRSKRAPISSVQWKSALCNICMYVCMYICIVFSMVHSCARLPITLTAQRIAHFMWAGVALTNAWDSSMAHTPQKKRKQIKEMVGLGERIQTE